MKVYSFRLSRWKVTVSPSSTILLQDTTAPAIFARCPTSPGVVWGVGLACGESRAGCATICLASRQQQNHISGSTKYENEQ